MQFGFRNARITIAILMWGLVFQITGCSSYSQTSTFWYPAKTIEGRYSNLDGVCCFEFRHQSGVKFTLFITGEGQGSEFNFLGEFLIPGNVKLQLAEQEFSVSIPDRPAVVVEVENLTVLDESLNRTIAIPADKEVIGKSNPALIEDRRHRFCSFVSNRFQVFTGEIEVKIPAIRINGMNWVLPTLLLKKHTGRVLRSFSP